MKNIKIYITKEEILEEVSLASAYAGVKSAGDEGDFERIAVIDEDSELLLRFWKQSCGEVVEKFRGIITVSEVSSDSMSLLMEVSNAYDEALTSTVISDIYAALAAAVTARWFRYTLPGKAEEWEKNSSDLLGRAYSKIYQRRRPTRP